VLLLAAGVLLLLLLLLIVLVKVEDCCWLLESFREWVLSPLIDGARDALLLFASFSIFS
jgi:hypothetical protein